MDEGLVDLNRQLTNEVDMLRGELQDAQSRLASRTELATAQKDAATAAEDNEEAIGELVVRAEALEQVRLYCRTPALASPFLSTS